MYLPAAGSYSPSAARGSIGDPATRGTQVLSLATCVARANADLGRSAVADQRVDADIGAVVLMQQRRAGLGGVGRKGHARQRLVVDRDALGAVLGGGNRLRHHDRERLADKARLVVRQREVRRGERRRAVGVDQRDFRRMPREGLDRGSASCRPQASPPGEDRDHARHRQRRRLVDRADHARARAASAPSRHRLGPAGSGRRCSAPAR